MHQEILYVKLDMDVETSQADVFLKDLGSLYCEDDTIVSKCEDLKQKECKIKCKGNVFVFPLVKIILYWEYNDEASYKNMINRYQYDKNKYNRSLKQRKR